MRELPERVLYAVLGAAVQQGLLESAHRRAAEWQRVWRGRCMRSIRYPWVCSAQSTGHRLRGGLMACSSSQRAEQRDGTDFCSLVTAVGPEGAAGSCAAGVGQVGGQEGSSLRGWWTWSSLPREVIVALSCQSSGSIWKTFSDTHDLILG